MFLASQDILEKYVEGYRMMLDFYGMELVNVRTGEINRSKNY